MIEGLGKRLQGLRMRRGLTQRDAAVIPEIECDDSVLASYERGIRAPKLDLLVRFARFYGVTTDYLLGLSEYESPDQLAESTGIPLSNDAINFLKSCNREQLVPLSLILSAPSAGQYLQAFDTYIKSGNIIDEDGQVNARYHELSETIGRRFSDDQLAGLVERWAQSDLEKVTSQIVSEIRESFDLADAGPKRGRPKKYKTRKSDAGDKAGPD